MSRTFYTYREHAIAPMGSFGPLDEMDDMYHHNGAERRLDPTPEQEIAAGWFNGPNLSNTNAAMLLRALDLNPERDMFDPEDVLGRILVASATDSVDDSGFPATQHGNFIDCGIRPGYFADRFAGIVEVCEQAKAWGSKVIVA